MNLLNSFSAKCWATHPHTKPMAMMKNNYKVGLNNS